MLSLNRPLAKQVATHWQPPSNNHVLNSLPMRLSLWQFGAGETWRRVPALVGGAIYIVAVFCLGLWHGTVSNNLVVRVRPQEVEQ